MTFSWIHLITWCSGIVSVLLALYGAYFVVLALYGLGKQAAIPKTRPTTRFAVLVAARNEERVIGFLIDSLRGQNYPKELMDILVVPNNCTDNTEAEAAAHGARIMKPRGPVAGKGDVLNQMLSVLAGEGRYDAVVVFDADNLVRPDYLQRMNDARNAGISIATGTRASKNPANSPTATGSSMIYWMLNQFYNKGRSKLKLSSLVSGCGFMVTFDFIRKIGGWHTSTITEDYEFSAQCVLAGERVHYMEDAIFYDEQPITFSQSWRQRRRWTTGYVQGMRLYLGKLWRFGVSQRDHAALDMMLTFLQPVTMVLSLLNLIPGALLFMRQAAPLLHVGFWVPVLLLLAGVVVMYAAVCVFALCMAYANYKGPARDLAGGILFYPVFLVSWLFVMVTSILNSHTAWEESVHTVALGIERMK